MEHKCNKSGVKAIEKCELNREQAIEILEKFDFFQGQRAGRELWNEKPFDVQEQDIDNFSRDVALLKGYIKELTEENEKLHASCTELTQCCTKLETLYKIECKRVDAIKADTVRKIHERLGEFFVEHNDIKYGGSLIHKILDQVANEMLEGKKK